jgi:hypothetical protein
MAIFGTAVEINHLKRGRYRGGCPNKLAIGGLAWRVIIGHGPPTRNLAFQSFLNLINPIKDDPKNPKFKNRTRPISLTHLPLLQLSNLLRTLFPTQSLSSPLRPFIARLSLKASDSRSSLYLRRAPPPHPSSAPRLS